MPLGGGRGKGCRFPSLISLVVSVDVKHHVYLLGRAGSEFKSCVIVEVVVLGFPS